MIVAAPPKAVMYGIYRRTNTSFLRPLVQECRDRGWTLALWALDEVSPEFEAETLGCGPGSKFALVCKLAGLCPPREDEAVLVSDDDLVLDRGTLHELLLIAAQGRLDLAQPAHSPRSYWSHRITIARPFARMRLTNFVEVGPLFAIQPWAHRLLYELPDDMGWGYELIWWRQWRDGQLRMGVVDAVRVTHTIPAAATYGMEDLMLEDKERLREAGFRSWAQLQKTLGTWFRWQQAPPKRITTARD